MIQSSTHENLLEGSVILVVNVVEVSFVFVVEKLTNVDVVDLSEADEVAVIVFKSSPFDVVCEVSSVVVCLVLFVIII